MNGLTTLQRKLVYAVGIVVLLIPVNWLGRPSGKEAGGGEAAAPAPAAEEAGGGLLARLRSKYDLGESNLGDVDPSSATMNLLLMGLRGIAVDQLWMQANKNQERKNWAALETNINSIILLQPHFVKVWEFQSWNLAYNVSNEWDLITDRYYWIKQGAKFGMRGTRRNSHSAELCWWVGIILGDRISHHDAWMFLRKFFNPAPYDKNDPFVGDPQIREATREIKPDPQINPLGIDNCLVAKRWFLQANDRDRVYPQRRMMSVTFRQRPARSQMAYAEMLQREGRYGEQRELARAWNTGYLNWTTRYEEGNRAGFGQELFHTGAGLVKLEVDPQDEEELKALTRLDNPPGRFSIREKQSAIAMLRRLVNYNYWKIRSRIEGETPTTEAHKAIYDGKQALKNDDNSAAIQFLETGLQKLADIVIEHPELKNQYETAEEIIIAIMAWRDARKLANRELPENAIPWQNAGQPKDRNRYNVLREIYSRYQAELPNMIELYRREFRVAE